MPVEERRRVALHRQMTAVLGEEAADTLFELITPAGDELATRRDLAEWRVETEARFTEIDARFEAVDARFDAVDGRLDEMDRRLDRMDARLDRMGTQLERMGDRLGEVSEGLIDLGRQFERRIADAVNTQTKTLVLSQLAALVTIAALAFGIR
jgi:monoamine oxidase